MGNILEILVEYSKKGQLMDYDALKKIVKYAIIEKNLENYITNIVFYENLSDSYKKNCRGAYNMDNHEIIFCEHGINEIYNQVKKSSSGRLSEYNEFIVANGNTYDIDAIGMIMTDIDTVSYRQIKDYDLSVIAKYFGGKGHRAAASNPQNNELFQTMLKKNNISFD